MFRLKELVPSVCVKDNVSQLDVILEAIRYIASLQVVSPYLHSYFHIHFDWTGIFVVLVQNNHIHSLPPQGRLADKIESGEVVPVMVPMVSTTDTHQEEGLREEEEGGRNWGFLMLPTMAIMVFNSNVNFWQRRERLWPVMLPMLLNNYKHQNIGQLEKLGERGLVLPNFYLWYQMSLV